MKFPDIKVKVDMLDIDIAINKARELQGMIFSTSSKSGRNIAISALSEIAQNKVTTATARIEACKVLLDYERNSF